MVPLNKKSITVAAIMGISLVVAIYYGIWSADGNLIPIQPGYGTQEVYVGMPADALPSGFGPPEQLSGVPVHLMSSYSNPTKGVYIVCYEDRVLLVTFYLRPSDMEDHRYSAFSGIVNGAITHRSSIEDVIAKFGKPTSRGGVLDSSILNYEQEGVEFGFEGEKLHSVTVDDPSFDMDEIYEKIRD